MASARKASIGIGTAVLALAGIAALSPAKADWGGYHGWHRHWHGWHRPWYPPAVIVAPRPYYPPAVVYAPPPVYYAPPAPYYPPGVAFGLTIH